MAREKPDRDALTSTILAEFFGGECPFGVNNGKCDPDACLAAERSQTELLLRAGSIERKSGSIIHHKEDPEHAKWEGQRQCYFERVLDMDTYLRGLRLKYRDVVGGPDRDKNIINEIIDKDILRTNSGSENPDLSSRDF